MQFQNIRVADTKGNVLANASVAVYDAGTENDAETFDENGNAITDLTTDAKGLVGFAAYDGTYDIVATKNSTSTTLENVLFFSLAPKNERKGFFLDDDPDTNILKMRDRVFVGAGAEYTGNRQGASGYGGGWVTDEVANYFIKNAQMAVASSEQDEGGRIGILGMSYTPPGVGSAVNGGVFAVTVNAGEASYARALYAEGLHQGNAASTTSIEIQTGNYTSNVPDPHAYDVSGVENTGIAIGAEGGVNYKTGDADTALSPASNPSGAAVRITGGSLNAAHQKFIAGVIFQNGALHRDGNGHALAMSLAEGHEIRWGSAISRDRSARLRSDVDTADNDVGLIFKNTEVRLTGASERPILLAKDDVAGAGAVNYWLMVNSRTAASLILRAQGDDTNIGASVDTKGTGVFQIKSHEGAGTHLRISPGASAPVDYLTIAGSSSGAIATIGTEGTSTNSDIRFAPKGSGKMRFGTHAAIGAETVTGYIEIKDYSGTVRKLAVVS